MANSEQINYWNGEAGQRWAAADDMMERILGPITEALLAHSEVSGLQRAVDVGCGGGSQTLQLARALGSDGSVLGIDISQPMLEVARGKVQVNEAGRAGIEFLQADASTHPFESNSFDLLFSRFGVMFFDDPVAAFTNLHAAMSSDGRLMFCCWQALKDNDWSWIPLQTALQYLPPPEPVDPRAPGPFAFADSVRLESILTQSGFCDVEMTPVSIEMHFEQGPTLAGCVRDMVKIGPIARLLESAGEEAFETICSALEPVLESNYRDNALHLPGAVWFVTALAS